MANFTNIIELADGLIERLGKTDTVKTASAEPQISSDLSKALRKIAQDLRNDSSLDDLTVAEVMKLATTGAQAQGAGATAVQGLPPPTLPGLSTGNMGMTAGGGGAMPEPKLGSMGPEMRHVLGLTGLGTAAGAGAGALTADEGHRLEGAALGGLAGGAYSAGIGGIQTGVARAFVPEVARADALRSIRSIGDLALQGGVSGLIGGTAASTLTSDAAEPKLGSVSPEMRHVLSLTGLGTAVGAGAGALTADEGHRLEGAALGGLGGGALGAGASGLQAGLVRGAVRASTLPEAVEAAMRDTMLRGMRDPASLALHGLGAASAGSLAANGLDEPSSKIAAILRKTAATLRAEHAVDQQSKIATAQHTVRAAAALHTLRT